MISGKSFVGGPDYLRKHLSANDYYEKGRTVKGRWIGTACESFGVKIGNEVKEEEFKQLQDNRHPATGAQLTRRKNTTRATESGRVANRRSFYDFTVSAPKSFSILAITAGADVVRIWHQNAVEVALKEMEKFAARQDHSGQTLEGLEKTGNFCAATFSHDANRALEPQLHEHVIIFNATHSSDGHNYAIESNEFFSRCGYLTAVYRNELARQATEADIEIEFDKWKAPQIKGMTELAEHFSSRAKDIEKLIDKCEQVTGVELSQSEKKSLSLASRGIDWRKFDTLWKESGQGRKWNKEEFNFKFAGIVRAASDGGLSETTTDKVIKEQLNSLSNVQRKLLEDISEKIRNATIKEPVHNSNREAIEYAIMHTFERKCVASETQILQTAIEAACGTIDSLEKFKEEFKTVCTKLGIVAIGSMLTPAGYIEMENEVIDFISTGKNNCINRVNSCVISDKLSHEQKKAVESIIYNNDRFVALVGDAGTGKTFSVSEIVKAHVDSNIPVFMFAPSNGARDVLHGDGIKIRTEFNQADTAKPFENAQSLQSLLYSKTAAMKIPQGSLIVLDEAGLASMKQLYELINLAENHNWKVLFTGDPKQHSSVEAGDAFRMILNYSGIAQFRLTDIKRQKETALSGEYRKAAKEFASGKTAEAFDRLDKVGAIIEAKGDERITKIADAYIDAIELGKSVIVVNPTHRENDAVSEKIREKLKEKNLINDEKSIISLQPLGWTLAQKQILNNYKPGHVLIKTSGKSQGTEWDFFGIERGKGVCLKNRITGLEQVVSKEDLKAYEVCQRTLMNIGVGDSVMLRMGQNQKGNELSNGQIVKITGWNKNNRPLTEEGKELSCSCLSYGYASTSHKSQGATKQVVIIGLDRHSVNIADMKTAYVAATRGSEEIKVFVENKASLERISGKTGERTGVKEYAEKLLTKSHLRKEFISETIQKFGDIFKNIGTRLQDVFRLNKCGLPFHHKPLETEIESCRKTATQEILSQREKNINKGISR